jgi:hypothetical protein
VTSRLAAIRQVMADDAHGTSRRRDVGTGDGRLAAIRQVMARRHSRNGTPQRRDVDTGGDV